MLTWPQFRRARPDLAEAGRALFYQFSVGLAFLATTRRDGRPRLHPMCPILADDGLFALIVPSPKRADLARDGFYAMHSFPAPQNEDAFYLTGKAISRAEGPLRAAIDELFLQERGWAEPPPGFEAQGLFEFLVDSCLLTRTTGHGDHHPQHTVWKAG